MIQRIINDIMVAYQSPASVASADDGKLWIAGFTETVLAESASGSEILSAWVQFKRGYDRSFWPAPGLFCKAIREYRADASQYRRAPAPALAPPNYHKPELVTEATRNRTLDALAEAEKMAASSEPKTAALGRQLSALGVAIIARNGPPS